MKKIIVISSQTYLSKVYIFKYTPKFRHFWSP